MATDKIISAQEKNLFFGKSVVGGGLEKRKAGGLHSTEVAFKVLGSNPSFAKDFFCCLVRGL